MYKYYWVSDLRPLYRIIYKNSNQNSLMPFATMATGLVPGSIEPNGKKNNGDNEQG